MSRQYPSGLITKNPIVPSGPFQNSSASGIWTLEEAAYWKGLGQWPTAGVLPSEVYFDYVTMLLHGNGAASGNTTVLPFNSDASTNAFNVTIVGDTKSNNFTPYQGSGYYSNYFNGSNYITLSSAPIAATGTFTFECWVYVTGTAVSQNIYGQYTAADAGRFGIFWNDIANKFSMSIANTSYNSASTYTANAWYHIAWVRDGSNNLSLYVNGVRDFTTTGISTSLYTGNPIIAARAAGVIPYTGYISNMRITNTAVYSGTSFTVPTTPLTAISGTTLLTCQSNRFIDNSASPLTLTLSGAPQVTPAQPFTLPSTVATYGSGYFDGSGDWLSVADVSALQFGTGAFTVECWAYFQSLASAPIFDQRASGPSTNAFVIYADTSGYLSFYCFSPSLSLTSNLQVKANSWNHIAFVRSGNAGTFYLNGVAASSTVNLASYNNTSSANRIFEAFDPSYVTGYCTDFRIVKGTAVYTSTFTPPTAPLTAITNTSLLTTQYNGGANNNGFKDSSQNNFPITRNGNTTQGTFSPYGANWSNYFTGANSLSFATNAAFSLNSSAFTIEAWVNLNSISGDRAVTSTYGGSTTGWSLQFQSGILYFYRAGDTIGITGTTAISAGVWNHIAVSGTAGSSIKMFINGVQQGSTSTGNITDSSTALSVGQLFNVNYLAGYVSNLRLVKGTALYTANFTPPTSPLTAVSGTSLLTCQSNRFIDRSANAFTCSLNGSPTIQRISPFAPTESYSTSVIGGSGYFDGSGDSLTVASNAAFYLSTGNFTVEAWVYKNSSGTQIIVGQTQNTSAPYAGWLMYVSSSNFATFEGSNGSSIVSSSTFPLNQWVHVASVRSSATTTLYINGTSVASGSVTITDFNASLTVGQYTTPIGGTGWNGYITDARIVKGTAVYTSAFTPPTAPLTAISGTSLLLNYTNAGIFDNSEITNVETVGNAMASTSIYKYGTGSLYFDGSGDYLQMPLNNTFNFGTNSFTIEMWVNPATTNHQSACFFTQEHISASNTPISICIYLNGGNYEVVGNGLGWGIYSGGAWQVSQFNLATIPINTWTFIALVRNGNVFTMYVNGTSVGSVTYSGSCSVGSTPYFIGRRWDIYGSYPYFNGNIDDFRLTLGIARYTANFTPPTSQFLDQ